MGEEVVEVAEDVEQKEDNDECELFLLVLFKVLCIDGVLNLVACDATFSFSVFNFGVRCGRRRGEIRGCERGDLETGTASVDTFALNTNVVDGGIMDAVDVADDDNTDDSIAK